MIRGNLELHTAKDVQSIAKDALRKGKINHAQAKTCKEAASIIEDLGNLKRLGFYDATL